MQFSLRRMMLAVTMFATMLGVFGFYVKRFKMFHSDDDTLWGWLFTVTAALAAGGFALAVRRQDAYRIVRLIAWTILGLIVGSMLSANSPPEFALPGGLVGGLLACIISSDLPPSKALPRR